MGFELNPRFLKELEDDFNKKVGEISLDEMFTHEFMAAHTNFESISEMIDASPLSGTSLQELRNALERPEWSVFVQRQSSFSGWEEMFQSAHQREVSRRLAR